MNKKRTKIHNRNTFDTLQKTAKPQTRAPNILPNILPNTLPTTTRFDVFQQYREHTIECMSCIMARAKGTLTQQLECQIAEILYYLSANTHDFPIAVRRITERYPHDAIQQALRHISIAHALPANHRMY